MDIKFLYNCEDNEEVYICLSACIHATDSPVGLEDVVKYHIIFGDIFSTV